MDCGRCSSSSPRKTKSVKKQWSSKRYSDEHVQEHSREWPVDPSQYQLLEYAGKGAHAVVYKGRCKAFDEVVAVKRLDLDCNWDLTALIREATLMKKFNHPAVLPLYAAFVAGRELWLVTPYMGLGSVRSIMKQHFTLGLDEVVIATIMQPVLLALEYVHRNNGIHRDIKADNILVSEDGEVVLADFGVAAARMRPVSMVNLDMPAVMAKTFVGTPCWMAPEVMQQTEEGYHTSADIWSFGITLIELAHGRPPLARMHPMRVLMDTMSKPPPQLDDHPQGTRFSKAFKDLVEECLHKDPDQRPTAAALLSHRFFRMARDPDFLKQHFLVGLPQPAPLPQQQQQQQPGAAILLNSPSKPQQQQQQPSPGLLRPLSAAGAIGTPAPSQQQGLAAAGLGPGAKQQQQLGEQRQGPAVGGGFGPGAARSSSGLLSGPSSSGPSRRISGWVFPSVLQPAYRLSTHVQDTAASQTSSGTGRSSPAQLAPSPGPVAAAGRGSETALGGLAARSAVSASAGPHSPLLGSSSSSSVTVTARRTGSSGGSAGSLEQQLQPFLIQQQQQAALRAASASVKGAGPGCIAAGAGGSLLPPSRVEALRLGSTRQLTSSLPGPLLEAYVEVEGAEEEAAAAAAAAGAAVDADLGTCAAGQRGQELAALEMSARQESGAGGTLQGSEADGAAAGCGARVTECDGSAVPCRAASSSNSSSVSGPSLVLGGAGFLLQDSAAAAAAAEAAEAFLAARASCSSTISSRGFGSTISSSSTCSSFGGLTQDLVEAMLAPQQTDAGHTHPPPQQATPCCCKAARVPAAGGAGMCEAGSVTGCYQLEAVPKEQQIDLQQQQQGRETCWLDNLATATAALSVSQGRPGSDTEVEAASAAAAGASCIVRVSIGKASACMDADAAASVNKGGSHKGSESAAAHAGYSAAATAHSQSQQQQQQQKAKCRECSSPLKSPSLRGRLGFLSDIREKVLSPISPRASKAALFNARAAAAAAAEMEAAAGAAAAAAATALGSAGAGPPDGSQGGNGRGVVVSQGTKKGVSCWGIS